MSKGGFEAKRGTVRSPQEQISYFADKYRSSMNQQSFDRLTATLQALHIKLNDEELLIFAALDTPDKVQEFLNKEIYYNWDHSVADAGEETTMSPRRVLQTATAHCFEGAMFALAVNYLHGHNPTFVLMEASQDSEHNLVIVQNPVTKLYGANAHSAFPNLDGRKQEFSSLRELAETYYPYYYSDRTFDAKQLTLVGYSEPFDLVKKFGVEWITSEQQLWDIYYTYIDDTINFYYLFDDSGTPHLYPLINALKQQWIVVDALNNASIQKSNFSTDALALWSSFWKEYPADDSVPTGTARELEQQFQKLTGTTPIDLIENVDELQVFLDLGYPIKKIVKL